jgi:hypothetical protein
MMTSLLLVLTLADGNFPPPEQIIEKAIAVRKAQNEKGAKFTWHEDVEHRDEKGQPLHPFMSTFDVIMLEGENYRKLILEDGQPLDAKTAKKVEADLARTREERKKHKLFRSTVPFGGPAQLERLYDNKVTGEEMVGARKVWRIESEPKSDAKPANQMEKEMLSSRRVTWFDEEDGIDVRRRTEYFRNVDEIRSGTIAEIEWGKIGDAWMPAVQVFHGQAHFLPGVNAFSDAHTRFYDYKRFTAESTFTPN